GNPSIGSVLVTGGSPYLFRFDVDDITATPTKTTVALNPLNEPEGWGAQLQSVSVDRRDGSYGLTGDWTDNRSARRRARGRFSADGTHALSWPSIPQAPPTGFPTTGGSSGLYAAVDSSDGDVYVVGPRTDGDEVNVWEMGAAGDSPWESIYADPVRGEGESGTLTPYRISYRAPAPVLATVDGKQRLWAAGGAQAPSDQIYSGPTDRVSGVVSNFVRTE